MRLALLGQAAKGAVMEDFDKEVEFALMNGLDPAPWESVADAVRSMEADETLIAALRRNGVV
jgi:hypothetical protein